MTATAPTHGDLRGLIEQALAEDAPEGDLTTSLVVPEDAWCTAELRAGGDGLLAGTRAAQVTFDIAGEQDGAAVEVEWLVRDGEPVRGGDTVASVRGPARTILRAERVAINLLGHLSGVASLTARFVERARPARILCTRKTTPGLRQLEREAVVAGGGSLHRASLSEAVLIKDNHLVLGGGIAASVRAAKAAGVPVEVEAETLEDVRQAVDAGADRVLLDNPTPDLVRGAIQIVGEPERLEVSGGVTLEGIGALVDAGARVISVGRITHSAPSLDLSLEVTDGDDRDAYVLRRMGPGGATPRR